MMWPYVLFTAILGWGIFWSLPIHAKSAPAEQTSISEEHKLCSGRHIYKISFDGHTYIYFRNTWSSSGDAFLHDPSCECLKEAKSEKNRNE